MRGREEKRSEERQNKKGRAEKNRNWKDEERDGEAGVVQARQKGIHSQSNLSTAKPSRRVANNIDKTPRQAG